MNDQSSGATEIESSSTEEVESIDAILSEDEKKEKLVYVFLITREIGELKVMSFNSHTDDTGGRFVVVTDRINKHKPLDLMNTKWFTMEAIGSTIYFIGGKEKDSGSEFRNGSNKVFAFDTKSWEWLPTVAPMKLTRVHPGTITYGNKLYVFGSSLTFFPGGSPPSDPAHWAEFYDPESDTWNYLGGDPPQELMMLPKIPSPAVFKEQEICLLCMRHVAVYVYSFKYQRWLQRISYPDVTREAVSWNFSVVALNNTLFWECYGRILEMDCPPRGDQPPVVRYTLPEAVEFFGEPAPRTLFHRSSCLVHAGNGKLCLVYGFYEDQLKKGCVRFHTFELGGRSRNNRQFLVDHKRDIIYPHPERCCFFKAIAVTST